MSPGFRYHVASLSALFLALGIGILIGTAFVGAPVVSRQTRLISRLEDNVGELRRETRERDRQAEALRAALPAVVRGRLIGRRVLVVQSGGYADGVEETASALEMAGAKVTRIALPAAGWPGSGGEGRPAEEDVAQKARVLAPLLSSGSEVALRPYRERGEVAGEPVAGGAFSVIVLVGGAPSPARVAATADEPLTNWLAHTRDLALAETWRSLGVTVVGVEPVDAEISFMRAYQSAGIPTIDAIDRPLGKMALPFLLLGEKGNYGLKETADQALPASLEAPPVVTPRGAPSPLAP